MGAHERSIQSACGTSSRSATYACRRALKDVARHSSPLWLGPGDEVRLRDPEEDAPALARTMETFFMSSWRNAVRPEVRA